ncbi:MAG: glycosyltransferase family 2 protein [Gemmatimonadales bacterium]|nr:MAG: glycosyltransferase family 2 protein [Gemmatimonadales bacterium]
MAATLADPGGSPEAAGPGNPPYPSIVALVPALNEEASLPGVLAGLIAQGVHRILVVDNGSTDATEAVARRAGATVVHEARRGYGMACLAGIRALAPTPPEAVLFLDGDQSDDPAAISRILRPILEGSADLVIGSRRGRGDAGMVQRGGTGLVIALARILHGVNPSDLGPFRAVRWDTLQALDMDDRTWGWTLQMQLRAHHMGFRVREVEVARRPRSGGESKISGSFLVSLRVGMRMLWTLGREWFRRPRLPRRRGGAVEFREKSP